MFRSSHVVRGCPRCAEPLAQGHGLWSVPKRTTWLRHRTWCSRESLRGQHHVWCSAVSIGSILVAAQSFLTAAPRLQTQVRNGYYAQGVGGTVCCTGAPQICWSTLLEGVQDIYNGNACSVNLRRPMAGLGRLPMRILAPDSDILAQQSCCAIRQGRHTRMARGSTPHVVLSTTFGGPWYSVPCLQPCGVCGWRGPSGGVGIWMDEV